MMAMVTLDDVVQERPLKRRDESGYAQCRHDEDEVTHRVPPRHMLCTTYLNPQPICESASSRRIVVSHSPHGSSPYYEGNRAEAVPKGVYRYTGSAFPYTVKRRGQRYVFAPER